MSNNDSYLYLLKKFLDSNKAVHSILFALICWHISKPRLISSIIMVRVEVVTLYAEFCCG